MFLCVTNRKLCTEGFLQTIGRLAEHPEIEKIILREKDLQPEQYRQLAASCIKICNKSNKVLAVNHFITIARDLQIKELQISMNQLLESGNDLEYFNTVGVSVHSAAEAVEAEKLGADYLIAGHIFATECKKGAAPKGLEFLKDICSSVSIPVYGIGGITDQNIKDVIRSGAKGGCKMSGYMRQAPAIF